eukprot:gene3258-4080_t
MYFCSWKYPLDTIRNQVPHQHQFNNSNQPVSDFDYGTHIVMLGDPQMEGDYRIKSEGLKGKYNIWFNDRYFRHIVSNIAYYLSPSLVFVLGDLFSSQYISDSEFNIRTDRYNYIFEPLAGNTYMVNITGNHDIGYANEASRSRIDRFESVFGKVNSKIYIGGHIFGIVNSINLDSSQNKELQEEAWQHLRELATESQTTKTPLILTTHIPLYKEFNSNETYPNLPYPYHSTPLCIESFNMRTTSEGHVIEQTMLSKETSQFILEHVKPVFIFSGHDHDGCLFRHTNTTIELV